MFGWLAGKIRWLFVILAIGGPVIGYLTWNDMQRVARIKAEGIAAEAVVLGGKLRTGKRGTLSFDLEIVWKDAKDGDRKAKVGVSNDYAHTLIRYGKFVVATIPIRYVPGTSLAPLATADPHRQGDDDALFLTASIAATVIGIFGFLAMWLFGRRKAA